MSFRLSPKRLLLCLPLLVLTTGCAAGSAGTSQQSTASGPKVNRLTLVTEAPPVEFNDVGQLSSASVSWQLRPMYESLVGLDPETTQLIPQLATQWSIEPDGRSYRFGLRKGIAFQKGFGEFTAKDLLIPLKERMSPDYTLTGFQEYWTKARAAVEIVNDYEAVYRLPQPDSTFLDTYMSEQSNSMVIFSAAHYEKQGRPTMLGEPLVGTGPYQFKERAQAEYLRFERVPYAHWRAAPDFPEFEFRWSKEASTRSAMLLAGEAQLADLPTDLLDRVTQQGYKTAVGKVPALRTSLYFLCCSLKDNKQPSLGWRYPDSPLMDVRVRRALSKAIDRAALNKAFFGGHGEPMFLNHFYPTRMGWNPDWEKRFQDYYGYDPDKARALLAEAGYGPNHPMSTTFVLVRAFSYTGADDVAEAVSLQWNKVGVQTTLLPRDGPAHRADQTALKYDNHILVNGTSSNQFTGVNVGGGLSGTTGLQMVEYLSLVPQIQQTIQPKALDDLWRKLGDVSFDQVQSIPLFWLPVAIAYDPKIVDGWSYSGALTGNWANVERIRAAR